MASLTGFGAIRLSTGQSALKSEAVIAQSSILGVGYFGSVLALSGVNSSTFDMAFDLFWPQDLESPPEVPWISTRFSRASLKELAEIYFVAGNRTYGGIRVNYSASSSSGSSLGQQIIGWVKGLFGGGGGESGFPPCDTGCTESLSSEGKSGSCFGGSESGIWFTCWTLGNKAEDCETTQYCDTSAGEYDQTKWLNQTI